VSPIRTTHSGRHILFAPSGALFVVAVMLAGACSPASSVPSGANPTGATPVAGSSVSPSSVSPSSSLGAATGTITLYTSAQQPVVDAVLAAFKVANPALTVELFRAPTGELAARIAAELRSGSIKGDVLWLTDPLSIQGYASQNLLKAWTPASAADLPAAVVNPTFWGTRIVNMVIVKGTAVTPGPATWNDLTDAAYKDAVAMPDPGFAGSAVGTLGYFALDPGYGIDFYKRLKANGAVQLKAPDDVTTAVAEGTRKAGITLDSSVSAAVKKGSPVELVWPSAGAVAIYSPIAVVDATANTAAAEAFVEYVLSPAGQATLGKAGQEPVRSGSGGPAPAGPQVQPDWSAIFGRQQDLLQQYRDVFGGG
jgi:iron(III) transport system substrate-binding protein